MAILPNYSNNWLGSNQGQVPTSQCCVTVANVKSVTPGVGLLEGYEF